MSFEFIWKGKTLVPLYIFTKWWKQPPDTMSLPQKIIDPIGFVDSRYSSANHCGLFDVCIFSSLHLAVINPKDVSILVVELLKSLNYYLFLKLCPFTIPD